MEVQLSTIFLFFILTVVLLASTTVGQAFPPESDDSTNVGQAFPPMADDTYFIRTSCEITRYPETCLASLSNYSGAIHHDAGRLAMVAIHVSLQNATNLAKYVSNMSQHSDSGNMTKYSAIRDCSSVFGDAVDQIHKSGKEMRRLGWTGESVRFQLSNVQTWMSAALTNEDTCMDGFERVADDDSVKADVCGRVSAVKEVTSNALALVNRYADSVSS